MTSNYELMYILRPDLADEQIQQEISKYLSLLNDHKAENISNKILGKRRLAYPIKKFNDGLYVQVNYSGDGKQIAPVERAMRLGDEVIRYLTTKLKDEVNAVAEETTPPVTVEAPIIAEAPVIAESSVTVEAPVEELS